MKAAEFSRRLFTRIAVASAVPVSGGPAQADATAELQAAIDALPPNGVIDGYGRSCAVTRLNLKSNMTMQNFRFTAIAGDTPLNAAVTIDGNRQRVTDVVLRNIHIDGNRAGQRNLLRPEDGGRDGFRIVGRARNIWIVNCSAVRCATDGLKIFSHDSLSGDDLKLNFEDIWVVNCRFEWNRRHGASGDSLRRVTFLNTEFNHNGLDLPGAATEGARAARDREMLYGAGIDVEGYGVGSGIDTLSFIGCTAIGNARFGIQFWEITNPDAPRFQPRRNIAIESCHLDGGVSPKHGRQALEFSAMPHLRGKRPIWESIRIQNCDIDGIFSLFCVADVRIAGGVVRSPYPGFYGVIEANRNVLAAGVQTGGRRLIRK
jgi:hypothetical protein